MSSRREEELDTLIGGRKKRAGCCATHPRLCTAVLLVVGVVCVAVVVCGTTLHSTIDNKVQDDIAEQVKLKSGSAATKQFKHSSAPMYNIYYFFNVTNADDVVQRGAKPNLVQLGPYAYKKNRTCYDLRWHDNDSVLEYKTNITYKYDPIKSNGHPDADKITTINTPLIGFFKVIEEEHSHRLDEVMEMFDYFKKTFHWWDGVFTKRSVTELLFGYDDPMLLSLKKDIDIIKKFPFLHNIAVDVDPRFNYSQRSVIEAPNMVHTGVQNISQANQYIMWNGNYNMSKWNNSWAAAINGTGGYAFHPQVTKEEVLYVFIDEVYRSGYFTFDSEILDDGIKLYKYVLPSEEMLNTTQKKFGFPSDNPSGVLDLTLNIDHHVPMFASKPHFLHADLGFLENVTGLHPNATIHDSYIGVEPITGAVLNAAKRIQLNLNLKRSTMFTELKRVRDVTMLPIYYGEQTGKVTPDLANDFKEQVYAIKYGISAGVWALVGVAGLVLSVSVMCMVGVAVQMYKRKHTGAALNQYASLDSGNV